MPYLYRSFSAKELYNKWLFGEKRPASQGILWVFATLYQELYHFRGLDDRGVYCKMSIRGVLRIIDVITNSITILGF